MFNSRLTTSKAKKQPPDVVQFLQSIIGDSFPIHSIHTNGLWFQFYKQPAVCRWKVASGYYRVPVARQLVNNTSARDPTYAQLEQFIRPDSTKTRQRISNQFVCQDFTETLHNKAEAAGIRCGYGVLMYITEDMLGHAINVFNTVDRGAMFIDTMRSNEYIEAIGTEILTEKQFYQVYKPDIKKHVYIVV